MRYLYSSLLLVATPLSFGQAHWEVLADHPNHPLIPISVSDDGTVVGGTRIHSHPFRWTAEEGPRDLELPAGTNSGTFVDMNCDGAEAVGEAVVSGVSLVFRWTAGGAPNVLSGLPQSGSSRAMAMSVDGSTVVGSNSMPQLGEIRAVRWVGLNAAEDLGSLGGDEARAFDVSDDGAVIVGTARDTAGEYRAFRWTVALGMIDLGVPGPLTEGHAVSGDGSTAFASRWDPGPDEVVRWTSASGPIVLATGLTDSSQFFVTDVSSTGSAALWLDIDHTAQEISSFYWSVATGVVPMGNGVRLYSLSSDGSVATGISTGSGTTEAVRWSPSSGLEILDTDTPQGSSGSLVTPDGTTVVGLSRNGDLTRWRSSSEVGLSYCGPAASNSTGQPAVLVAKGTNSTQPGQLDLVASSLPSSSFGFFLASRMGTPATAVVQSQGFICLGGPIGRFVGPGQILNSGAAGEFEFAIPVTAIATPMGPVSAQHGETWFFQAWFRDANPTATSNFTNGVRVTFY